MDSWISSPDGLDDPESVYRPVRGMLRPNMVLLVVDTGSGNPQDFRIDFIQKYSLPSSFLGIELLQQSRSFADFPDQRYLYEVVTPAYVAAIERQRPAMKHILTRILDRHAAYDRIILPQRNSTGRSAWCIGLIGTHFLLPAESQGDGLDDADLAILQLLAEGASTREIADVMSLSPRTIEHRVERLKSAFGARNIAHLVGLSISAGMSGSGRRND